MSSSSELHWLPPLVRQEYARALRSGGMPGVREPQAGSLAEDFIQRHGFASAHTLNAGGLTALQVACDFAGYDLDFGVILEELMLCFSPEDRMLAPAEMTW
eukprot:12960138-Alexandrium_andersonii.AAC.1